MSNTHLCQELPTQIGNLTLVSTEVGLRAVLWPKDKDRVALPDQMTASTTDPILCEAATQLGQYFAKERTDFQQEAWKALARIPYGETWTYKQQAELLGRPKAVRAVGAANGKNPVSIVLPCHRVIGSNGTLTGFAGGLDTKKQLLLFEGALSKEQ